MVVGRLFSNFIILRRQNGARSTGRFYGITVRFPICLSIPRKTWSLSCGRCGEGRLPHAVSMAFFGKELMNRFNEFGVQPFKDALKLDYAMAMVAWLSLRKAQKGARYPQILGRSRF